MRKHVRPADKLGQIWNPELDEYLPPEGCEVTWSLYWERLKLRGDEIVVSEPKDAKSEPKPQAASPQAAPAKTDGSKPASPSARPA